MHIVTSNVSAGWQWRAVVVGGDTCGDIRQKAGNRCTLLCPKSTKKGVGERYRNRQEEKVDNLAYAKVLEEF